MSHDIVFQLEFFFLLACAQIAATLTGFIGIVFVMGERAKGNLSAQELAALFHFMFAGMGTLVISLLSAILLVCFADHELWAWRLACGANALFHLVGAGRLALETLRQESGIERSWVTCGVGMLAGSLCLVAALDGFAAFRVLILMLATLWALMVTMISFTSLLSTSRRLAM